MNNSTKLILLLTLLLAAMPLLGATLVSTIDSGFSGSGGVSVGPDGNIYVSDYGVNLSNSNGSTIWKITPQGERSVFVNGLRGLSGSDFDSQGNLFQSHLSAGTLLRITPDGVSTIYSTGFSGPIGVAVNPDDEVFVSNCGNNSIRKAVPNGASTQFATSALLSCPNGLTSDDDGNLYTVNFNNSQMLKITAGGVVTPFAIIPGGGNGHVRFHGGNLYTVSWQGNSVYRVSLSGQVTLLAGSPAPGRNDGAGELARFFRPNGIDLSADGSIIYLNDTDVINSTDLLHTNSLRAVQLDALEQINPGIIGNWYNPDTNGSGFLFDLVDDSRFFAAWYSYVGDEVVLNEGENAQRWFTLQGTFTGNTVEAVIYQTTGGIFLSPDDVVDTVSVGSATITFLSCTRAEFSFQFDNQPAPSVIPLSRIAPDVLCKSGGLVDEVTIGPGR